MTQVKKAAGIPKTGFTIKPTNIAYKAKPAPAYMNFFRIHSKKNGAD